MRAIAARTPIALALLLLLVSCRSSRFTPEAADREVARLVAKRRACVPDVRGGLALCPPDLRARAARDNPPSELTLAQALQLGTIASRDYLRAREEVYLAGLTVTDARNPFRAKWSLGGSVGLVDDDGNRRFDSNVSGGVTQDLTRGGVFLLDLTLDVLRNLAGDPIRIVQTILNGNLTLPLARDAGRLVALESLRQAERNLLYELRDYARFQRVFTVDVASRYYRVLLLAAIWENEKENYRSLQTLVEQEGEKAPERIPEFQVDQARQDMLRAEDAEQRARLAYERALDTFKLFIGLPVDTQLALDPAELAALRKQELVASPFTLDRAQSLSLCRRLDLLNERGRERDALRGVRVAMNAMRAQVDLVLGGRGDSPPTRPLDAESAEVLNTASIVFDLPTERTAERNALKRAMIAALRARRSREAARDGVLLDVRDAYRDLEQAETSHRIQTQSVRLAERRVENTQLLLEQGRTEIRNLLESRIDLVQAQNALAQAVVDHVVARLTLERDAGVLAVAADGSWTARPPGGTSAAPATSPEMTAPEGSPDPSGSGPSASSTLEETGAPGVPPDSSALGAPPVPR